MLAVDGVSARDIHSSLRSILSETDAGDIAIKREGADRNSTLRTHAVVRPTGMNGFDLWQMENSFIRVADRDVRASDFMQICRREAKNCIPREKQENVLRVAFNHKIIPILQTALSTVIGMIPFLIDSPDEQPFWFSLAVGTMGGLAFSIVPLVVFLPLVMKVDKVN